MPVLFLFELRKYGDSLGDTVSPRKLDAIKNTYLLIDIHGNTIVTRKYDRNHEDAEHAL